MIFNTIDHQPCLGKIGPVVSPKQKSLAVTKSVFLFYQGLLKKHEAFETDLEVHRERVQDIEDAGNKLIEQVNS